MKWGVVMKVQQSVPALVVGAGPAGLVVATTLARQGIEVLLVERRPGGSAQPRATVLSLRTMELLRSWGLEERVLAGADPVEMTLLELPSAARAAEGVAHDVGIPTLAQSMVVSPTAPACVAQDHLENVLLDHLSSLPCATVLRGVEAVAVETRDDGVVVGLREVATGRNRVVAAGRLVAADGARSTVRSLLGIDMVGPASLFTSISVEFRAPLWDVLGDHRHLVYTVTDPAGSGVLLPAGQGDRWLFGLETTAMDAPEAAADPVRLRHRIVRASGVPGLPVRIERFRPYAAGAQLATTFARGRALLVGDAAHRVTPRGGTGLNIAVGDGIDLGWKLAWVLRGWAPDGLLATYEQERRPAVAHNVRRSADPLGSRRPALSEMQVDLGGRLPHAWVDDGRSVLDLVGSGLTLLVAGRSPAWGEAAAALHGGPPVDTVTLPPMAARALGLHGDGAALLVRPDGVPVARWWSARQARVDLRRAVGGLLAGRVETDDSSAA
jgi:2-polyprenyl-6-methoxyphenol hydroxylase-like FAD-dependent oxidoreductase